MYTLSFKCEDPKARAVNVALRYSTGCHRKMCRRRRSGRACMVEHDQLQPQRLQIIMITYELYTT
jgi:hypothetical protein